MRALITGGMGHVGSHLAALLRARSRHVSLLDRMVPDGEGFALDVTDDSALQDLFRKRRFDVVFHLAGLNAAASRADMERVNIEGTRTVLRAAAVDTKVVIMSSSAVYGACLDDPITEKSALAPAASYGASKAACEALAMEAYREGRQVYIARPFNIIGPGQRAAMLQTAALRQLVEIERDTSPAILKMGYLGNSRDFIDVRDIASGLVAIMEKGQPGQAYNLCSGHATKARALVEMLVRMSEKDVVIQDVSEAPDGSDVAYQRGSADKLWRASGWAPTIQLEQSLSDSLAWQRQSVQN